MSTTPEILDPVDGLHRRATQNVFVKNTKTGGGVFGSASCQRSASTADVAAQGHGSATVRRRYGSSQLGDVTVHPDGTLELRSTTTTGLFSLETHPTKKLDIYAYYGGEYNQRTVYVGATTTANNALFGYGVRNANDTGCFTLAAPTLAAPIGTAAGTAGSPATANCASPTRIIQEGVLGFTYRVVNSPKYGRLQYQATYSYLQKNTWSGVTAGTTAAPTEARGGRAENNMIHVGMRYYIP